jgi:hypothetical protein
LPRALLCRTNGPMCGLCDNGSRTHCDVCQPRGQRFESPQAHRKTTAGIPSGAWDSCTSLEHQAMGHSLAPRRPPATPNYRWLRGLWAQRTPHSGTWGLCRRRDRGAPVWGDRRRCSAVARRWRREAERSSAGTLLCDAHGKVATVEVGAIERGDRGVGAFLRLHLDEAETS